MIPVSIIVPVYKAEAYLEKCFTSIEKQTFTDFEVVVIDDGSPDHSGAICDVWGRKDKRFRVYHQENKGIGEIRQIGITLARGEYIVWVDADDWIREDLVEKVIHTARQEEADIVVFGASCVEEKGKERSLVWQNQSAKEWRRATILGKQALLWNFSVRRELWEEERVPDAVSRAGEDGYLSIQLFQKARKIYAIPDVLYFHLIDSPDSVSHTMNAAKYFCNFWLWQYRMNICRTNYPRDFAFCAARVLSAGVKAFSLSLLQNDLTEQERSFIIERLRDLQNKTIKGRYRDKFLKWCILHGYLEICRYYARQKVHR